MFDDDKEFRFPSVFEFMFEHPGVSLALSFVLSGALFVGTLLAIKVIFF